MVDDASGQRYNPLLGGVGTDGEMTSHGYIPELREELARHPDICEQSAKFAWALIENKRFRYHMPVVLSLANDEGASILNLKLVNIDPDTRTLVVAAEYNGEVREVPIQSMGWEQLVPGFEIRWINQDGFGNYLFRVGQLHN